jgi:hypothetical protein
MFNSSYIKHLEKEIEYLREQIINLNNMIIAFKDKTVDYNFLKNVAGKPDNIDVIKADIDSMPAQTEEEKKAKQLAIEELEDMMLR